MSDESHDPTAGLRDELDGDAQRYERASAAMRPVTAADKTGTVLVQLDKNGILRLVTIKDAWRGQVGVDELPAAVLEAHRRAIGDRTAAWARLIAESADEPAPASRLGPAGDADVAGGA